jgi:hypothetical protein
MQKMERRVDTQKNIPTMMKEQNIQHKLNMDCSQVPNIVDARNIL